MRQFTQARPEYNDMLIEMSMSGPKIMFTFMTGPRVFTLNILCPDLVQMEWMLVTVSEMVILDVHSLTQMPNVLHLGSVQTGSH